jgi:predicted MFS family arabinose efflux permease
MRVLWRNRDYMLLWGGQVVSTLGSMASSVVYPLLILALTGSPEAAGIATALRFFPYLVLSLPVGALIDRWDRKRVMVWCDVGRGLATASIPLAMAFDALTVAQLYVATFVEGSLFVFFNIAEVAALPRVVPKEHLPEAAAQNDAGFAAAHIAGPSLGTLLFGAVGRAAPFVFDTFSYAVSAFSLLAIRTPFHTERKRESRPLAHEVVEGLRWLWGNPLVRYMAFLTGGLNLVNAGTPLMLIVLAKDLGAPDTSIGVIFSIAGVGGILGAIAGGQVQKRWRFGQVITTPVASSAVLFPLYALAPSPWLLGIIGGTLFFLSPIYNVVQFSYRVGIIPDELQGRVNSTFRLLAFGFMPVGGAAAGFVIERFGPKACVLAFGAELAVLALLTALNRSVRDASPMPSPAAA